MPAYRVSLGMGVDLDVLEAKCFAIAVLAVHFIEPCANLHPMKCYENFIISLPPFKQEMKTIFKDKALAMQCL